jgi:NADH-quinone oxidoreductase subunit G
VPLFKERADIAPTFFKDMPEAFRIRPQKWLVLPQYDVFGSGELSIYTKGIKELSPIPYASISMNDANKLGMHNDSTIKIKTDENEYSLPLKVKQELPDGIVLVSAGLQGMPGINWGEWIKIELAMEQQTINSRV